MKRSLYILTILTLCGIVFSFVNPPHLARAIDSENVINYKRANPSKFTHPFNLSRDKIKYWSYELSDQEFNRRFDALEKSFQDDSYFVVSEGNDWIRYLVFDKTKPISLEIQTTNDGRQFYQFKFTPLASYQFEWNINKQAYIMRGYNFLYGIIPKGVGGNFVGQSDIISLVSKQRIEYPEGYDGDTFVGGDSPVLEIKRKKECDNLDFVCFFKKALSSTISTIQDLFKGITHLVEGFFEFLKNIFIPSDTNFFAGFFKQMDNAIHKKLGFLTFPFDFFNKSFNALFAGIKADDMREWHCGKPGTVSQPAVCRGVCIPKLLGNEEVCVRFGVLEEVAPWLWIVVMPIMRAAFVVWLCFRVADKYYEVIEA